MTAAPPIFVRYEGEGQFAPVSGHWARMADKHYVIGERYEIDVTQERSSNSHRHYFASLHEAWANLPENLSEQFATSEHLRKRALIECGYRDERSIVCQSKAEAQRVAAFIKPMDGFAYVVVREATVLVFTAQSQSSKAMGAKAFQESKTKVLDWVSAKIGVAREELERADAA